MNNSGSSSSVIARHDYLPFGEETSSGIGLRTSGQGYGATDTNRQKYGLTERDDSSGLDHTWWRKYENRAGRWTTPDPYNGSMTIANPQSFNHYVYVGNDPVNFIDPTGLFKICYVKSSQVCFSYDGERTCFIPKVYWVCEEVGGGGGGSNGEPSGGAGGGGGGGGPQKPPTVPPKATSSTCNTISGGEIVQGSAGLIVDSNSQVYPTFGFGFGGGLPASYTHTRGSGPIQPGFYLYGTASSGLAVTHTVNVLNGNISREVGFGTPTYGAGVQVVLPQLEGTTDYDRRYLHADYSPGHGSWCGGGHRF